MCEPEKNLVMLERAKRHIKYSEGYRDQLYRDSNGYITGGFGHCLDTVHPFPTIRDFWESKFIEDFEEAREMTNIFILENKLEHLSCVRRSILIDMIYNMGYAGVSKFKRMIRGLKEQNYELAAQSMKESLWYEQTGRRAHRLYEAMLTDSYPLFPGGYE